MMKALTFRSNSLTVFGQSASKFYRCRELKNSTLKTLYVPYFSVAVDLFGFPRAVSFIFVQDDDQGAFGSGQGSSYANFPYLITPFEALQSRARKDHFQINSFLDNYDHDGQNSAAVAAEANDAFCLVDVRQSCSEGYDIANLTANWEGDEMILAVASACSKTIVAYSTCNPFNVTAWVDHPNVTAIINAGGGGQEAGHALADVLFGDVNPSARLPYTVGYQASRIAAFSRGIELSMTQNCSFPIMPLWSTSRRTSCL